MLGSQPHEWISLILQHPTQSGTNTMHNRILGFDGLRAISVFLVIMSHAVLWDRIGLTDTRILAVLSADNGVKIFFMLSGFLITLLLIKESSTTGRVNILDFFVRRFLRIFPLYYLSIGLLMIVDRVGAANIQQCTFGHALTYTINFAPKECRFQSTSHFWSLAVEEHFYLAWPIIFALNRRLAFMTATAVTIGGILLEPYMIEAFPNAPVTRWTFPAIVPITMGCICAYIAANKTASYYLRNVAAKTILAAVAILGILSPAFSSKAEPLWLAAIACLILLVFFHQGSLLVRALNIKPLVVIGTMSYGLYVWQGIFTGNGPYRLSSQSFPPSIETGLVLTLIAAPLSYYFFEKPLLRLKKRFSWHSKTVDKHETTSPASTPQISTR